MWVGSGLPRDAEPHCGVRRSSSAPLPLYLVVVLAWLVHQGLDKVPQLLGRKFVAFKIGGQRSVTVDHQGMQRMRYRTFIRPEVQTKRSAEALHIGGRASEKMPSVLIALPILRIFGEDLGLVVHWIEGNAQQNQILFHAIPKTRIEAAE